MRDVTVMLKFNIPSVGTIDPIQYTACRVGILAPLQKGVVA